VILSCPDKHAAQFNYQALLADTPIDGCSGNRGEQRALFGDANDFTIFIDHHFLFKLLA
jgi:hypothetical protein